MKQGRRFQRIFFLSLLAVSVLAPIFLFSSKLRNLSSSIGQKEFIEDVSSIKYKTDDLKLNAVELETGGDFKEPNNTIVFEDSSSNSLVSYRSSYKNESETVEDDEETANFSERSDIKNASKEVNQQIERSSTLRGEIETKLQARSHWEVHPKQIGQVDHTAQLQQQRIVDEKVREMKDQVISATVYLSLAPPGSNSHMVKELKLRIKELERAMGEATKDSELSRNALQKSKAMEGTLSKADRIYDCSAVTAKLHAMADDAEKQVKKEKNQVSNLVQLAARSTSKGLHCLIMQLTVEYHALRPEERHFPSQQKLSDPDLYHYAVFSNNVLATAVVVNSTVSSAVEPEKIVFHVVTNSLNIAAISMWFLLYPPGNATIQVQSMNSFEELYKNDITLKDVSHDSEDTSLLDRLRFYLPDVFPALDKIVLFDHDVVIQRDLTALWRKDMKGKVIGVVETCQESEPSFNHLHMFINFSDPFVADRFNGNTCTWAFGMNLFDLEEWRRQNLTALYNKYLHLGNKQLLWKAGSLPLGWITFYNQTVTLDRRWLVLGLGYESGLRRDEIERAAVIHYDGVMKPWLEIGIGKYKGYWSKHLNYDLPKLQQCNIHE